MANQLKQKDGRSWQVTNVGMTTLKRRYQLVVDGVSLGANGEVIAATGLPAIGSTHPTFTNMFVDDYEFSEGQGSEKRSVEVTVNYSRHIVTSETIGGAATETEVTAWGWDASTETKELNTAADGTDIKNTAGDAFESVPQVEFPSPVFTKVFKTKSRIANAMEINCVTNNVAVTIGGKSCIANSLLAAISEKRLIGDETWKYEYTVQLRWKSNPQKLGNEAVETDIGWDLGVVDAGMRELDPEQANTKRLRLIRVKDGETGVMCAVTSPELLDGSGHAANRDGSELPRPYVLRFSAYSKVDFPSWMYSEPA